MTGLAQVVEHWGFYAALPFFGERVSKFATPSLMIPWGSEGIELGRAQLCQQDVSKNPGLREFFACRARLITPAGDGHAA